MKKILIVGTAILLLGGTGITAFASSVSNSNAKKISELTGRTMESVIDEHKNSNKTYGTIATEEGVFNEFKNEVFQEKKDLVNEELNSGAITQEEADEIISNIEEREEQCDGSGVGNTNKEGKGINNGKSYGENGKKQMNKNNNCTNECSNNCIK